MDTSEQYIKMCEKAEEIQELASKDAGSVYMVDRYGQLGVQIAGTVDFYWLEKYGNGQPANKWVGYYWESDKPTYYDNTRIIWLPRQDQLQEMLYDVFVHTEDFVTYFTLWYDHEHYDTLNLLDSMEQLWLAFTVREKYNKKWDGNAWVSR